MTIIVGSCQLHCQQSLPETFTISRMNKLPTQKDSRFQNQQPSKIKSVPEEPKHFYDFSSFWNPCRRAITKTAMQVTLSVNKSTSNLKNPRCIATKLYYQASETHIGSTCEFCSTVAVSAWLVVVFVLVCVFIVAYRGHRAALPRVHAITEPCITSQLWTPGGTKA